jgi:hypothetical protein
LSLGGLITARDGTVSLTKLAAATAHFLMAAAFLRLQVLGDAPFNEMLWIVYGGFSIAHAAYDKTAAMVKDVREKRIDAEAPPL